MAPMKIICETNNVDYIAIRHAMCDGARTIEEVQQITGACTTCDSCKENLPRILNLACGCKQVSMEAVVTAVQNGADTVEKVGELTGAGTGCGRCQRLVANVIELGR